MSYPPKGNLYPSFRRKLRNTVVHLAEADTHFFRHITLAKIGVLAQHLQQAVADFLFIVVVHRMNFIGERPFFVKGKMFGMGKQKNKNPPGSGLHS